MPEFLHFLSELREHMQAELTRSDILRALIWPNAGLLLALIALATGHVADWLVTDVFYMLCFFLGLYGLVYIVCFFIDRDALRSEKYKLQKMAIERGIYGDSTTGVLEDRKSQLRLGGPDATAAENPDE
jgi:hypothetical protein